jgi:enoyl-CoA hydratase
VSVDLELRGPALWARINRPRAGNACSSDVLAGLEAWLERSAEDDVQVAVLTGIGGVFCAGADVREAAGLLDDRDALLAYLRRGFDLVGAIMQAPVPVVAAVNGVAFAGGLELVQACDVAIAARSARLGDRHVRHGQIPGWGSSAMLPRIVGPKRAARLLLTGEDLTAEQAERWGLVTEVVEDSDLQARVQALAGAVADAPERLLGLARSGDLRAGREREWAALVEHTADPATHAATRGFSAR